MQPGGFEEKQAPYGMERAKDLIGQIRRLGTAGPAYKIMSVNEAGNVEIEVVYSGERVKFP